MKKNLTIILAAVLTIGIVASCDNNASKKQKNQEETTQAATETVAQAPVELMLFHGKQRCVTCMAIEEVAKQEIAASLQEKVDAGDFSFKLVDVSASKENEALADKYEIATTSLLLVKHTSAGDEVNNLTQFAFMNARNNPDAFKEGLRQNVLEYLN